MNQRLFIGLVLGLLVGAGAGAGVMYSWFIPGFLSQQNEPHDEDHSNRGQEIHRSDGEAHREDPNGTEENPIRLSSEAIREAGIEVAEAQGGTLEEVVNLPGEITLNADTLAHIVPRVTGIALDVRKNLGDEVMADEVMAVLESRELAEARAADLAAEARLGLARASLAREEELRAKKISSEQQYLEAKQRLAEAEIEHRTTEAKLHSLGLSEEQVHNLAAEWDTEFSRYEIKAPFAGTVVEKHITLGELITGESDVFELADLSTVWVNLTVYPQYLPLIRVGQPVTVIAGAGRNAAESSAVIEYVSPLADEATRTAVARVRLPNPEKHWRPGLFVTARVQISTIPATVLVPKDAVQTVNGESCVFVETGEGFKSRLITVGRSDGRRVEIAEGLHPGERYVSVNAFTLKSELEKEVFGEGD